MKKTLFWAFLLCGMVQVNAATIIGKNGFDVEDAKSLIFGDSDSFAVSFSFDEVSLYDVSCNGLFEFNWIIGTGDAVPEANRKSYKIVLDCYTSPYPDFFPSYTTFSADGVMTSLDEVPSVDGPYIVQYLAASDSTTGNAHALFSYFDGNELKNIIDIELDATHKLPTTIGYAKLSLSPGSYTADAAVWKGVVTADDIMNPTYETTVPEPATATLGLLALAGLAARRRRC